jgi:hypothetical protein
MGSSKIKIDMHSCRWRIALRWWMKTWLMMDVSFTVQSKTQVNLSAVEVSQSSAPQKLFRGSMEALLRPFHLDNKVAYCIIP